VGQQDFVGIDYYWGIPSFRFHKVNGLMEAIQRRYAHAPVWPWALYRLLRYYARLFPGRELLIVENGLFGAGRNALTKVTLDLLQ